MLRPYVLQHDFPESVQIVVLSIPNTIEAIFGMSIIGGILSVVHARFKTHFGWLPDAVLYLVTTVLAGTYVLTQEFRLHNLGGNNIYDPYDVAASILGLIVMLVLFLRFGILDKAKPEV